MLAGSCEQGGGPTGSNKRGEEMLTYEEWPCLAELSFSDLGEDSSHTTDRRAFGLHVFIQRNVICAPWLQKYRLPGRPGD